eukprot:3255593-Rhodomonas_salina.1
MTCVLDKPDSDRKVLFPPWNQVGFRWVEDVVRQDQVLRSERTHVGCRLWPHRAVQLESEMLVPGKPRAPRNEVEPRQDDRLWQDAHHHLSHLRPGRDGEAVPVSVVEVRVPSVRAS